MKKMRPIFFIFLFLTGCQFQVKPINWSVVEVGSEKIVVGNYVDEKRPGSLLAKVTDLDSYIKEVNRFTSFSVSSDNNIIIGMVPERNNPLYSQGSPAFFDRQNKNFFACTRAPTFWDVTMYERDDEGIHVLGNTFEGALIYNLSECKVDRIIIEKDENNPIRGVAYNNQIKMIAIGVDIERLQPMVILVNPTDLKQTHLTVGKFPNWSPNGQYLAYMKNETTLGLYNFITNIEDTYSLPEGRYFSEPFFAWGKDNVKILFEAKIEPSDKCNYQVLYEFDTVTKMFYSLPFSGVNPIWFYE